MFFNLFNGSREERQRRRKAAALRQSQEQVETIEVASVINRKGLARACSWFYQIHLPAIDTTVTGMARVTYFAFVFVHVLIAHFVFVYFILTQRVLQGGGITGLQAGLQWSHASARRTATP